MIIKHKHHFLRYLHHGGVFEVQELGRGCCCSTVGRLMSTAAAREVVANDGVSGGSNSGRKRGARLSRQERKSAVVDFVNKYRLTNAGKFPTVKYTMSQVGGSYYTVRSIVQELEHDSKLPKVTVTDKTTIVGKSKKGNGISDVSSSVDSVISPHISGENDVSNQGEISEKRKAPGNEVSARTDTVMSIPLKTTVQSKEILDSDVSLCEAEVAPDDVIASEDFANGENMSLKLKEGPDHEVPEMVDIVNECRMSSEEDSSSSVMGPTVETADSILLVEHTDTDSLKTVLDSEVVVDSSSGQNKIVDDVCASGTSVDLNLKEERKMSTSDVVKGDNNEYLDGKQMSGTEKTTVDQALETTSAAPGSPSKPDNPQSLSSSSSTELPEMDKTSSPASASQLSTSDSMEKTEEKQSLWGNLKSFATGFINIWRKS